MVVPDYEEDQDNLTLSAIVKVFRDKGASRKHREELRRVSKKAAVDGDMHAVQSAGYANPGVQLALGWGRLEQAVTHDMLRNITASSNVTLRNITESCNVTLRDVTTRDGASCLNGTSSHAFKDARDTAGTFAALPTPVLTASSVPKSLQGSATMMGNDNDSAYGSPPSALTFDFGLCSAMLNTPYLVDVPAFDFGDESIGDCAMRLDHKGTCSNSEEQDNMQPLVVVLDRQNLGRANGTYLRLRIDSMSAVAFHGDRDILIERSLIAALRTYGFTVKGETWRGALHARCPHPSRHRPLLSLSLPLIQERGSTRI